jgi:DNA-binding NarL/FixJ family response regulator
MGAWRRRRGGSPIRILVADHRRMVRSGIKVMLSEVHSINRFVVAEAADSEDLLLKVKTQRFQVILVANDLAGSGGIKATALLTARQPGAFVLALLDTVDRRTAEEMIKAGASGCVLKSIEPETLLAAIRTVLAGRRFYSNELAVAMMDRISLPKASCVKLLTRRERDLLKAIMRGMPAGEIAAEWGVCKRTVDKHREHLKTKLGVRNMVQLVMAGIAIFG